MLVTLAVTLAGVAFAEVTLARVAHADEDDFEVSSAPASSATPQKNGDAGAPVVPASSSAAPPSPAVAPSAAASSATAPPSASPTARPAGASPTTEAPARVGSPEDHRENPTAATTEETGHSSAGPKVNGDPSVDEKATQWVRGAGEPSLTAGIAGPYGLVFSGYVQAQFEHSALSEDEIQQGGLPLNHDRFLIRRARLRVDRSWKFASTTIEIDGNTTRAPSFGLRRAEVSLLYRNEEASAPPYVRLTAGLSEIPFGYEMTDSSRSRYFMERSLGSLALFPADPDLGVRVSGGWRFLRYALGFVNGEPLDDRPGRVAGDPNAAKDLVGRFGVDVVPAEKWRVSGGFSFLYGRGFHAGQQATKSQLVWKDGNENNSVDQGEISSIPGSAATPSQNFKRWAVGADVEIAVDTKIGKSRLYGELFIAQNADRGVFPSDPIASGSDTRGLGFYAAALQEIKQRVVVGVRTDHYIPSVDTFDKRAGNLIPTDSAIRTVSPLVAILFPERVRLTFQYDAIFDSLARNNLGVPTDLKNDQFTIRLQGEL